MTLVGFVSAPISRIRKMSGEKATSYKTRVFTSFDKGAVYLCVKMLDAAAMQHAEDSDYKMQLCPDALRCPSFKWALTRLFRHQEIMGL